MFLLVPAYPGCPGSKAVKRSLLLLLLCYFLDTGLPRSSWKTHTHTRLTALSPGLPGCKTKLDFTEARVSEWQWHQLGHMQICISLQTDNHASTLPLKFFAGRMPFLSPSQQRQCTEGNCPGKEGVKWV